MNVFIALLTTALASSAQTFQHSPAFVSAGNVINIVGLTVPTFVRSATNTANSGTSITITNFDCTGGNYLLVFTSEKASISRTVSGLTCNTIACTQTAVTNFIATTGKVYIHTLASPTTGDIVATLTGSATSGIAIGAVLFNGVGGLGATDIIEQTSLAPSSSVAPVSLVTDLVVDVLAYQDIANNFTTGGSQTIRVNAALSILNAALLVSTKTGTASTTTMSWSVDGTGAIMSQIGLVLHGQ